MKKHSLRFWLIFAGLAAAFFIATGATFASLGVILPAMIETLSWTWAEAGLGFTSLALFTGLFSPASAVTLKTIGIRGNYAAGASVMAVGFFLLASVNSLAVYVGATALLGVGFALIANVPSTYVIGEWTHEASRGSFLGAYLAIGGLGGVAGPLVAQSFLGAGLDWRLFWIAAGAATIFVGGSLALVLGSSRAPQALGKNTLVGGPAPTEEPPSPLRDAFFSPAFAVISASLFVAYFCGVTVNAWAVTHLQQAGIAAGIAAGALSLHAAANTGARIVGAIAVRKITPRVLLITALASEAIGMALLSVAQNPVMAFAFATFEGYAFGMVLFATTMLQIEYFGHKNAPALLGGMNLAATAAMAGPLLTGYVGDKTGSFSPVFVACAVAAAFLALVVFNMKAQKRGGPQAASYQV